MNRELELLWCKLDAFVLDEPGASDSFTARLARENRWSVEYASAVIREYKRFALLAVAAGHALTPSDQVDQAWHLHLTYTESYWKHFCPEVLGRPLQHRPSRGGASEHRKHAADYEKTLESYTRIFGEAPPREVWPDAARRFGLDTRFERVNAETHWIVRKPRWLLPTETRRGAARSRTALLGVTAVAAAISVGCTAAGGVFPLSLSGPSFLMFFALFAGLLFAGAYFANRVADAEPTGPEPELNPNEIAYLAGGPRRAVETALASLVAAGVVTWDARAGMLELSRKELAPLERTPLESELHSRIGEQPRPSSEFLNAADRLTSDIRERLASARLYTKTGPRLPFALALAVPALGTWKILIGSSRGQPVAFLLVLTLVTVVVAVSLFKPRPGPTRRGNALLRKLMRAHAEIQTRAREASGPTPMLVPLGVALFGLAALVDCGFPSLAYALGPIPSRSNGSGDGGSAGAACGGGGGGGDGGGGCGGCGGCGGGGD